MDVCGGAARGLPSHDADFVVSHPTKYRSRLKPWQSLDAYMQSVLAHHCQREGICGCMSRLMRHAHVSVDQTFLNPFSLSHDDCQRRVCAAWSFGSHAMGATPPHGFTWIAKALMAPAQEDGRRRE